MPNSETKTLQVKQKAEVSAPAEQTVPGPVFTPAVDIFETDTEITLLADIPGVKPSDLSIDLRDSVLTLDARVDPPESPDERVILREYQTGKYYRQFTLSQVIDQDRIDAKLEDGVLRLRLPKTKAATPRKIKVKTG